MLFVIDTSSSMAETTAVEGRLKLRGAEEVSTKNDAEHPRPLHRAAGNRPPPPPTKPHPQTHHKHAPRKTNRACILAGSRGVLATRKKVGQNLFMSVLPYRDTRLSPWLLVPLTFRLDERFATSREDS